MQSTTSIITKATTHVIAQLKKNMSGYKKYCSEFFSYRSEQLYDTVPCDRIFFTDNDYNNYFSYIKIDEKIVKEAIDGTYYAKIPQFNPRAAKDPLTIAQMSIIRYFYMKKDKKELELAMLMLAFSGKFYPSIHYASYPTTPPSQYRHVMDYVVNNELTEKYDIKSQGSVLGAIKSVCYTWLDSYGSKLVRFHDDDVVYVIQQLHNRIKSFMKNIAEVYYKIYKDKDKYMAYDRESLDPDAFNLSTSDSQDAERYAEKTMETINTKGVDYRFCKQSSDINIRTEEIKSIIEMIIADPKEQSNIKELVSLIIVDYFAHCKKDKDIHDIAFVNYSIVAKPNAKDEHILRQKEIIESWLTEKSPSYRKRMKRIATRNSYHNSIKKYFVLTIYYANK